MYKELAETIAAMTATATAARNARGGIMAGSFYNRFCDIRLPDYLAFFAGRRFVPIVSGFAALLLAAIFGYGFFFESDLQWSSTLVPCSLDTDCPVRRLP